MRPSLYDYQLDAADGIDQALKAGENPLCVIPTGGGKSLVLSETIERLYQRPSKPNILLLSHVKELIEQDANALRRYAPDIPLGIFSAGLRKKQGGQRVVMGTVQTIVRNLHSLGSRQVLLIDEAHLCPREERSMYGKVFDHFGLALRAGYTATNMRLDSGSLTEGGDAWFDRVAYEIDVRELIKRGRLVPLSGVLTEQQAILDSVRSRAGDFIAEQAEREVMKLSLDEVIDEAMHLAQHRKHILVFAAGVDHAKTVVEALKKERQSVDMVVGDTAKSDRSHAIERFREGKLRFLVSVGVLTTGFDAPMTDAIIMMRPTKSPVLWTQMLGRAMRISPATGKRNALLLDFVGNLERLGGAGCVVEVRDDRLPRKQAPGKRKKKQQAWVMDPKTAEFYLPSAADPMSGPTNEPFDANVMKITYYLSNSKRQPGRKLVIVDYKLQNDDGFECAARGFLCVEYVGTPRLMSEEWFKRRGCIPSEIPRDAITAMALAKSLHDPHRVRAMWDPKLNTYMVVAEFFTNPNLGF